MEEGVRHGHHEDGYHRSEASGQFWQRDSQDQLQTDQPTMIDIMIDHCDRSQQEKKIYTLHA